MISQNQSGQPNGEAMIEVETEDDFIRCLICNKSSLDRRIISVDRVSKNGDVQDEQKTRQSTIKRPRSVIKSSKTEDEQDSHRYLKLQNLPWKITEKEIKDLLLDCEILGDVIIMNNEAGRPTGDAVVKLLDEENLDKALKHDKETLHERNVALQETDAENYIKNVRKVEKTGNEKNVYIRLKGLVWSATEDDIEIFLHDCKVKELFLTTNEKGKPTGEAYVQLENEDDVEKAMKHNKKYLRERFVIIEQVYQSQYMREAEKYLVQDMEVDEIKDHQDDTVQSVKKAYIKYRIRPSSNEIDVDDILEDCKDMELDGVIWDKGDIVEDSENKSMIELGCTVTNNAFDSEMIRKELMNMKCVGNV